MSSTYACCDHCSRRPHEDHSTGHPTPCSATCSGSREVAQGLQSDEDDEYLAMVEGQRARALATVERVRALLTAHDAAYWAVCGVREADIRAALEPK